MIHRNMTESRSCMPRFNFTFVILQTVSDQINQFIAIIISLSFFVCHSRTFVKLINIFISGVYVQCLVAALDLFVVSWA